MSKRVVEIVQDGSYRAGQPAAVLIHEGDTVDFNNAGGAGTTLVLTEETRKILSPATASTVEIAAGASVSFQVKQVSQKTYCCQVLPEGTTPEPILCEAAGVVAVLDILASDTRSADLHTGRGL